VQLINTDRPLFDLNVSFLKGLVIPEGRARVELQLAFSPEGADNGSTMQHGLSVTTFTGDEHWNENCRGSVVVKFALESQGHSFETLVTYREMSSHLDPASTRRIQLQWEEISFQVVAP